MKPSGFELEAQPEHQPVMVEQVIKGLDIDPAGTYIDATFGGGGHSRAILRKLGADGKIIAIDADANGARSAAKIADARLSFHHANFCDLDEVVSSDQQGKINGVLFDLGISSLQLDSSERGFTFAKAAPLDMRLDVSSGPSLLDKLSRVSETELGRVLREYGQERRWKKVARLILRRRREGRLNDTADLAAACASGPGWKRIHPATRTFQALRIWVNDELSSLVAGLAKSARLLCVGGRLVAISFHSLEDRIVKHFLRAVDDGYRQMKQLGKMQRPDKDEQQDNRRSRSACLRVGVKL